MYGAGIYVLAAMAVSATVVAALQLTINIKGSSTQSIDIAISVFQYLNAMTAFVDLIFDVIEFGLDKLGILNSEIRRKLESAKSIVSAVLNVTVMIATTVAAIVATAFAGGSTAPLIAMSVASLISSILTLVNGVFEIIKGVKALKAADIQYRLDMLRNVIESMKSFLQVVQDNINAIIEHMQMVIDNINSNWVSTTEMIKNIGETNVGIARAIGI